MESSWSSGLPRRFVFHWIGYYYWVWKFVHQQSSNIKANLLTLLQSSRPSSQRTWEPHVEKWLEIDNNISLILKPWSVHSMYFAWSWSFLDISPHSCIMIMFKLNQYNKLSIFSILIDGWLTWLTWSVSLYDITAAGVS
jgi:hypothetical protein